jgi:signal transduction histidine kinase
MVSDISSRPRPKKEAERRLFGSRVPGARALEPALRSLAKARLAAPLLYFELSGFDVDDGANGPALRAACRRAAAHALRRAVGRTLRRRDVAVAGPQARWFAALLVDRSVARECRASVSDADLGLVAGRLRSALQSSLDEVRRQTRCRPRIVARAGWTVIEPRDDSSPLRELRHALRGAAVVARIEEKRATLLAAITHELRTPLTSIIGFAERLLDDLPAGSGSPVQRRALTVLGEEARRLHRLVEGLIDFGAWNAGRLTLHRAPMSLGAVATRVTEALAERAAERRVRLSVRGDVAANLDADRIMQVMTNVVDNAIRHARDGGRVDVRIAREAGTIAVDVSDDGAGFDPKLADSIGSAFAVGAGGRIGLGLAISRLLVAAHGGTIGAGRSKRGGAQLKIRLPSDDASQPASQAGRMG